VVKAYLCINNDRIFEFYPSSIQNGLGCNFFLDFLECSTFLADTKKIPRNPDSTRFSGAFIYMDLLLISTKFSFHRCTRNHAYPKGTEGSNPSLSAIFCPKTFDFTRVLFVFEERKPAYLKKKIRNLLHSCN